MSDNIKKLTILHSNDMHGDFLPKLTDGKETGGLLLCCFKLPFVCTGRSDGPGSA